MAFVHLKGNKYKSLLNNINKNKNNSNINNKNNCKMTNQ